MHLAILIFAFAASAIKAAGGGSVPQQWLPAPIVGFFEWLGELGTFCGKIAKAALKPPYELKECLRQFDALGAKSLPLVTLAGAATGVVLSLQTRDTLIRFGAKSVLPTLIIFSMLRETGPIITGLVVSGRAGAGIGAELGSMKVTEQIDAMEASAVNPHKYLAVTRILACIVMLPLLTLAADFAGIIMGWLTNTLIEPVSFRLFINQGFQNVTFHDFLSPTLKTAVFGLLIGLIATFQGMRTQGGTEGVGRSATSSVVLSSLAVILSDVILVRFLLVFFPA